MIYLKLIGCAFLMLSAALLSHLMNRSLQIKKERAESLLEFVRYVRTQVDCFGLSAAKIISRCDRELLRACGVRDECDICSFEELSELICVEDEQTRALVLDFFRGFGKKYRDEQLDECDYYIARLGERAAKLSQELPLKKRMNATLCLSGAAGVLIIFV